MKKLSLVLITVDCLRADHVGLFGYSRPVTPYLDSLAAESKIFSNAVVVGAPTYFSFPGIMASRYPLAFGRDVLGVAPEEPTLASTLHDAGYQTAAFLAGNPYLSARFGYDQGFEIFRDFLDSTVTNGPSDTANETNGSRITALNRRLERATARNPWTAAAYQELYFRYCQWLASRENPSMDRLRRYPAADIIVDQARAWLSSLGDQPFFLWLHLMDPHHPYYPPHQALAAIGEQRINPGRARFLNSFWNRGDIGARRLRRHREEVVSLYDAGIHWVDCQLSRLAQALQQFHRWDETIFVLTADHGEEFLEHDERYHSPVHLPETLIRVPLVVRVPGGKGSRIDTPLSHLHLAPTLLEALQVQIPGSFRGRSRWKEALDASLEDEPVISECGDGGTNPFHAKDRMRPRLISVRAGKYKLIVRFGDKTETLYDLSNDSDEKSPLPSNTCKEHRSRLLSIVREHIHHAHETSCSNLALKARVRELVSAK